MANGLQQYVSTGNAKYIYIAWVLVNNTQGTVHNPTLNAYDTYGYLAATQNDSYNAGYYAAKVVDECVGEFPDNGYYNQVQTDLNQSSQENGY